MLPLYAGPVLAGWAHHPPKVVFALAAIFALFVMLTRAAALRPSLIVLVVVQLLLCGLGYALGLFLAARTQSLQLALWLPITITLAAALLGAWRYHAITRMDALVHEMSTSFDAVAAGRDRPAPESRAAAMRDKVSRALWHADPDPATVDSLLAPLTLREGPRSLALLLADLGEGSDAFDLAVIRFAAGRDIPRDSHLGLTLETALNSRFAPVQAMAERLAHQLMDEGAPLQALPDDDWLREAATQGGPPSAGLLARLQLYRDGAR